MDNIVSGNLTKTVRYDMLYILPNYLKHITGVRTMIINVYYDVGCMLPEEMIEVYFIFHSACVHCKQFQFVCHHD